jgi:hypothetical protein
MIFPMAADWVSRDKSIKIEPCIITLADNEKELVEAMESVYSTRRK